MNLTEIYHDNSLYGHSLINLPHRIWDFTKGEFFLNDYGDPGTLTIESDYNIDTLFLIRKISYSRGYNYTYRSELITQKPLFDAIEFIGRRIFGSFFTALSFPILPPIGFIAKIFHFSIRSISIYVASTTLVQKIRQVWNNADLFGDALTSAPLKCYRFATAPLGWHLRADGSDRRAFIRTGTQNRLHVREAQYSLVPFELFEFPYRRIIGGTLTLTTSLISPFGLLAKSLHLASRSVFQT